MGMSRQLGLFRGCSSTFILAAAFSLLAGCGKTTAYNHAGSAAQAPTTDIAGRVLVQGAPVSFTTTLISLNSGKCLDVSDISKESGAAIQQWDCWGGANQSWTFVPQADGYYEIVSVNSGKCLDIANQNTSNGANLIQWDCAGSPNQLWAIQNLGNDQHVILSKLDGKCVDIAGVSKDNGAIAWTWDYLGGANQIWNWDDSISAPPSPSPTPSPSPSPIPSSAPIVTKQIAAGNGSSSSYSLGYHTNVTSGSLLVACASLSDYASAPSLSDNNGNTWVLAQHQTLASHGQSSCWYAANAHSGATTVTVSSSGAAVIMLTLTEVSGVSSSSPLDRMGATSGTGGTVSVTTDGSVAQPNEYVMGYGFDWTNHSTWNAGGGYTLQAAAYSGITALADKNVRTGLSGAQTVTFTKNNTSDTWQAIALTFKGNAGVSPSPSPTPSPSPSPSPSPKPSPSPSPKPSPSPSQAPSQSITLSISPASMQIIQGNKQRSDLMVQRIGGFSGALQMSAQGLPSGMEIYIDPKTITGTSAGVTVVAGTSTPAGIYNLTITAQYQTASGSMSSSIQLPVTVTSGAAPSPSPKPSPSPSPIPSPSPKPSPSPSPTSTGSNRAKLIEVGWHTHTIRQLKQDQATIERSPFDGVLIEPSPGSDVFAHVANDPSSYSSDISEAATFSSSVLTDNFVRLRMGAAVSNWDWFSDSDWAATQSNVTQIAKIAAAGHFAGLAIDPESYTSYPLPWKYDAQPGAASHSFAQYKAQVRKRGAQFMNAIQSVYPQAKLLHYGLLSFVKSAIQASQGNPSSLDANLTDQIYGLEPAFLDGMLDAVTTVQIIDGDEESYDDYRASQFDASRAFVMETAARVAISPENQAKYASHVTYGAAVYMDSLLTPDPSQLWWIGNFLCSSSDRLQVLQSDVYNQLRVSDRYSWFFNEQVNWYTGSIPAGVQSALTNAKSKYVNGQSLGFSVDAIVDAAEQRQSAAYHGQSWSCP
jgi:hypothetical protein